MSRKPKVTYVLCYPAGLVRGGLEIQARRTMQALETLGEMETELFTPLSSDFGDIVHFFGDYDYFWEVARLCIQAGVPYVCSPVLVKGKHGLPLKWQAINTKFIRRSFPRGLARLLQGAHLLFTNTALEEAKLRTFFGNPLPPMIRVPNGVERRFFDATPDLFLRETGIDRPFVLHSGSIEPRKNQHRLIAAARQLKIDLVLMGREPDKEYLAVCRAAADSRVHFLGELPSDSPLIPSANAAAAVFCLPSFAEVLSLASLEAAATGTPVILGNTLGAEEYFGTYAKYVAPASIPEICSAIASCLTDPPDRTQQRAYFAEHFSWDSVAQQFLTQYRTILDSRTSRRP